MILSFIINTVLVYYIHLKIMRNICKDQSVFIAANYSLIRNVIINYKLTIADIIIYEFYHIMCQ